MPFDVDGARARRPPHRARRSRRPSSRGRPVPRTIRARSPTTRSSGAWSSPGAGSRPRRGRPAGRSPSSSVPSASARTIVYKGLVIGGRLPDLYPDLRAPLTVGYAVFHQRYATNTHPVWRLAQPFRSIAHNGEINTVRGNREQVRGRRGRRRRLRDGRASSSPPAPLLSADGSRFAVARRGARAPDDDRLGPDARAPDRDPRGARAPPRTASARRHAPPPDGRLPGAVGRAGRDRLRRRPARGRAGRPQRAAAGGLRRDPRPARRRRVRGRRRAVHAPPRRSGVGASARASSSSSSRGRRAILEDAEAKARALRAFPIHDAAAAGVRGPLARAGDGAVGEQAGDTTHGTTTDHVMRYLAGLDAERARLDIKTMALEGHEPLWSMGDDTPTPGRGRLDRPVADHLRQAFAQVTNPAIDPERERVVMDLRVELGRRPALLGGPPRAPRTVRLSAPDRRGSRRAPRDGPCRPRVRPRRSTRRGIRPSGPAGLEAALDRLAAEAVAASRRGAGLVVVSDAALVDRPAARAVDPRDRCRPHRPDRRRPARPDRPRGQRRRHPRRPRDGHGPRGRRDGGPSAARDRARRGARRARAAPRR